MHCGAYEPPNLPPTCTANPNLAGVPLLNMLSLLASCYATTPSGGELSLRLTNYDNMQYAMPISIGTPYQSQQVLPDSGSTELVVLGAPMPGHHHFSAKASNSSNIPHPGYVYQIVYGSATAYGKLGSDIVKVGRHVAKKQEMLMELGGASSKKQGGLYYGAAFDGIEP